MKLAKVASFAALAMLVGAAVALPASAGDPAVAQDASQWPLEPKWTGPGPMPRHQLVLLWGVPEPYTGMTAPQPRGREMRERGKAIYQQYCAICHGDNGAANTPVARSFSPPPGNLVWLSDVPEKIWDPFMYWTIAEGGTALGTSMPPYRQLLTSDEIWAVTAYIQENIPFVSRIR
jgi:mono/diheme cytochrome c family protein